MSKVQTRMRKIELVKKAFARVSERRVPDVVPERDRLNELAIESQCTPDGAGSAGNELNVQTAPRDIVIFIERKDLRLVRTAAVIGAV